MELNSVLITWENRPAALNFLRDVTENRELEDKLQQAQRMEAVGTLAAGIAHDFNNLLMGIQGNATLMLMNMDANHPHYEKLNVIEAYVRKGAELTKQLMGFTKSGKYAVQPTDMNQLVQNSSEMFGRRKMEITIYTSFEEHLWTVLADQRQIEQVFIHFYVNAYQAMPGGGAIHLATENVALNYSQVAPYGLKPGNFVKISVKDTSEGMDKETQSRIFDPFFSTRKLGRGTGLGLAAAYGIVKNHGGFIDVESRLGEGTVFLIYLPANDKPNSEFEDIY
jgi:signal transduction histidine kinase